VAIDSASVPSTFFGTSSVHVTDGVWSAESGIPVRFQQPFETITPFS
jgi:hypothetical protein